jgi:hypothetical protein
VPILYAVLLLDAGDIPRPSFAKRRRTKMASSVYYLQSMRVSASGKIFCSIPSGTAFAFKLNKLLFACNRSNSRAAVWDIMSQSLNYAGASMSGPTIFAIIYSSVTIWTAIFSQIFLGRIMNLWQWVNVLVVFAGLTVTATDSVNMGPNVVKGSILIIVGSAMHGLTYIICEAVMTVGDEKLTVIQNNFLQGSVAGLLFLVWQLVFTLPRSDELIWRPMENAGTSFGYAVILLGGFGMSNVVHSITYFHTLLHFPGGATSAGVMKGLQAVFVFVFTSFLYCNKLGGSEMCFSQSKFVSLVTVTGGVVGYGYATKKAVPDSGESNDKKESEHVHETSMLLPPSP